MRELQLTQAPEDHRLYDLRGVGELRVGPWPKRRVQATSGAGSWTFEKRGSRVRATDRDTGETVAEIALRPLWKDASARWRWKTVEWELRPADAQAAYVLARPGEARELVTVETLVWGRRPVPVAVDDMTATDPGLVLFVVYAVRVVADEMTASAAGRAARGGGPNS